MNPPPTQQKISEATKKKKAFLWVCFEILREKIISLGIPAINFFFVLLLCASLHYLHTITFSKKKKSAIKQNLGFGRPPNFYIMFTLRSHSWEYEHKNKKRNIKRCNCSFVYFCPSRLICTVGVSLNDDFLFFDSRIIHSFQKKKRSKTLKLQYIPMKL